MKNMKLRKTLIIALLAAALVTAFSTCSFAGATGTSSDSRYSYTFGITTSKWTLFPYIKFTFPRMATVKTKAKTTYLGGTKLYCGSMTMSLWPTYTITVRCVNGAGKIVQTTKYRTFKNTPEKICLKNGYSYKITVAADKLPSGYSWQTPGTWKISEARGA